MYETKNLEKLKSLEIHAPEATKAFWAFDKAALSAGALGKKEKELIAIAIALTTQCPYCIQIHSQRSREAGATEEQIAEVILIAAALRAGAAITHGAHALA